MSGGPTKTAPAGTGRSHRHRTRPGQAAAAAPVDIDIVDELGLPVRQRRVTLTLADGSKQSVMTDGDGKIHPRLRPGDRFEIKVDGSHEIATSDASQTASGQHLAAASGSST